MNPLDLKALHHDRSLAPTRVQPHLAKVAHSPSLSRFFPPSLRSLPARFSSSPSLRALPPSIPPPFAPPPCSLSLLRQLLSHASHVPACDLARDLSPARDLTRDLARDLAQVPNYLLPPALKTQMAASKREAKRSAAQAWGGGGGKKKQKTQDPLKSFEAAEGNSMSGGGVMWDEEKRSQKLKARFESCFFLLVLASCFFGVAVVVAARTGVLCILTSGCWLCLPLTREWLVQVREEEAGVSKEKEREEWAGVEGWHQGQASKGVMSSAV